MARIDRLDSAIVADETAGIRFFARLLLQTTLPHRRPSSNAFTRTNGDITLTITGNPNYGIPWGVVPRLVLSWLTTRVVQTQQQTVGLGGLGGFMRGMGMECTGGTNGSIARVRNQTMALFSSNLTIIRQGEDKTAGISLNVAASFNLWHPKQAESPFVGDSAVTLSAEFYREVLEAPVPVPLPALQVVQQSPLGIDLLAWLCWRTFNLRQPAVIPWPLLAGQFGAGYRDTKQGRHNFRTAVVRELGVIRALWPSLKVEADDIGLTLRPGTRPLVPALPRRRGSSPCG